MTTGYVEYACFGSYNARSEGCLLGCIEMIFCVEATYYIPHASIGELTEALVSPSHSVRSRAKTRLEKLREENLKS